MFILMGRLLLRQFRRMTYNFIFIALHFLLHYLHVLQTSGLPPERAKRKSGRSALFRIPMCIVEFSRVPGIYRTQLGV